MSVRDDNATVPPRVVEIETNDQMLQLCGEHDRHLSLIESHLPVSLVPKGNRIAIVGEPEPTAIAERALRTLQKRVRSGVEIDDGEVAGAVRVASDEAPSAGGREEGLLIRTQRRIIAPRSVRQSAYVEALQQNELVFGLGPAGTGKTYLAVAVAVSMLMSGGVDRIILTRPAVEAGERLGFLPGTMDDKIDPYMRPMYDALYEMMHGERVMRRRDAGDIEIAPLAYMRGRTLANAFIILDEAQNTTPMQMKMFLTRMGENSRMAVTGDPSQVDLPLGTRSGLADALDILSDVRGVARITFDHADVVRHPLVTRIVRAYDARDSALIAGQRNEP